MQYASKQKRNVTYGGAASARLGVIVVTPTPSIALPTNMPTPLFHVSCRSCRRERKRQGDWLFVGGGGAAVAVVVAAVHDDGSEDDNPCISSTSNEDRNTTPNNKRRTHRDG